MTTTTLSSSQVRSVIGPLTTTFTRPSNCSSLAGLVSYDTGDGSESSLSNFQAQRCSWVSSDGITASYNYDDVACWPAGTGSVPTFSFNASDENPTTALNGRGIYSPGLVCPQDYATACWAGPSNNGHGSSVLPGSSFKFQFDLLPEETAIGCCPSGYQCFGNQGVNSYQSCVSVVLTGLMSTYVCPANAPATQTSFPMTTLTVPVVSTSVGTETFTAAAAKRTSLANQLTTTISPPQQPSAVLIINSLTTSSFSLVAPMFQLNWKETDLPASLTEATTLPIATSTTNPAQHSGSLATSTKVAIGVAVPVIAIAAIAVLISVLLMRRKRKARQFRPTEKYQDKPELDATSVLPQSTFEKGAPSEMPPSERPVEIGEDMPHELPAPNAVQELDGTQRTLQPSASEVVIPNT